jgi:hypothetical protein
MPLRIEDAGDGIVNAGFLSFLPGDVAVKAVVSDHPLTFIGNVGAYGSQSFQRGEYLCLSSSFDV